MDYEVFVTGPLLTNCYVLWDHQGVGYIIDPGGEDMDNVISFVKGRGIKVKYVLSTHGHFDHVSGVNRLKREFPSLVFLVHERDLELVHKSDEMARRFSVEMEGPPEPDGFLDEVDGIEVINTPGHTMGSVCFLVQDFLFTGDTLFKGTVGRVDLGGDAKSLFESLQRLKEMRDDLLVLPGHGSPSTLGDEKRDNPFMNGTLTLEDI